MLSSFYSTNLAAPEGASGTLTVPDTTGIGPVIPLKITRIDKPYAQNRLYYWGCSDVVLKDQPEHRTDGWKNKEQWWVLRSNGTADAMKMQGLTAASKLSGNYLMDVSYAGKMDVTLGEGQEFLPPLKVTSPEGATVDTTKPIKVVWEPAAGVRGYHLMAVGKSPDGKDVTWESAYNATVWQRMGATKALKKGLLKGPEATSCTIPAGIFKGQVSIIVTGVGPIATGKGAFSYWGWAQTMTTKIANMGT